MPRHPVLVIHGGAGGQWSNRRRQTLRRLLRHICDETSEILATSSAVEAVAYAVRRFEDHPAFNAGTGSVLQRDGAARMSASIMDGAHVRFAAVLNIERVRNPVLVAKLLLAEPDRVLAGAGAMRFARSHGIAPWNPVTSARLRQWRTRRREAIPRETVGAVALDRDGRLAAATSTGGKGFERVGRVSDSGLPVGNYANHQVAISCTGLGEEIIDEGLAVRLAQHVADGASLRRAFACVFRELRARVRRVGAIGVDRQGQVVWQTTLPVLFAAARCGRRLVESF